MDRVLSQEEIDSVFRHMRDGGREEELAKRAQPYDFRRPDRIAKDQLRAIHLLHENFARSLASSLSAYLRAYVMVNLISVEQISFREFTQCLPSPTCLAVLSMKPFEGNAALELNPALVFPILEMLLGGDGKRASKLTREVTEIEQSVIDGVLRIILQNLKTAWQVVAKLDFAIESHETEPGVLQILAPNEALMAIGMEIRVGDNTGLMNIGIPSIVIKMLRQKFDQQWSVRKSEVTEVEQARVVRLIKPSILHLDARLQGEVINVEDLLNLKEGDVLSLDSHLNCPLDLMVNGSSKFRGNIVAAGNRKSFQIQEATPVEV